MTVGGVVIVVRRWFNGATFLQAVLIVLTYVSLLRRFVPARAEPTALTKVRVKIMKAPLTLVILVILIVGHDVVSTRAAVVTTWPGHVIHFVLPVILLVILITAAELIIIVEVVQGMVIFAHLDVPAMNLMVVVGTKQRVPTVVRVINDEVIAILCNMEIIIFVFYVVLIVLHFDRFIGIRVIFTWLGSKERLNIVEVFTEHGRANPLKIFLQPVELKVVLGHDHSR